MTPEAAIARAYIQGITFIAWNDEPTCSDFEDLEYSIPVMTLSEAFDLSPKIIATDILTLRRDHGLI